MMLSWWQGLILGLVQGLTEFLPVSSSGHLVLAEYIVGYRPPGVFFEVVVHLATLLSVVVAYRKRLAELLRGVFGGNREAWRYASLLLVASIPAGLAGVLLKDFFERTFHSRSTLGWSFLVTAAILWSTPFAVRRATGTRVTLPQAVLIGIGQAIAIIPGVSRSGTTIATALWSGLRAEAAAEFSFLMSIVVIAGSGLLMAGDIPPGTDLLSPGLLLAFVAAAISGLVAIRFLIALLRHRKFHIFAPYCAVVGVLCLVWFGWMGK